MKYIVVKHFECHFLLMSETIEFEDDGDATLINFNVLEYKLKSMTNNMKFNNQLNLNKREWYIYVVGLHKGRLDRIFLKPFNDIILDVDNEDAARLLFELGEY